MSVKVAGWDGATDVTTVIAALQWVVSHRARYGIRVVNLSWGTDSLQPAAVDPLNAAVQRAWQAGLVVVVSAGQRRARRPVDQAGRRSVRRSRWARPTRPARRIAATTSPAAFSSRGATGGGRSPTCWRPASRWSPTARPARRSTPSPPRGAPRHRAVQGHGHLAGRRRRVRRRRPDARPASPGLTPDQVKAALLRSAYGRLAGPAGGAGLVDAARAVDLVTESGVAAGRRAAGPASTGLGSLDASRGTRARRRGRRRRRRARPAVAGEIDVLGAPWDAAGPPRAPLDRARRGSSRRGRRSSRWSSPAAPRRPAWAGPPGPRTAWEAAYWGAALAAGRRLGREVLGRQVLGRPVLGRRGVMGVAARSRCGGRPASACSSAAMALAGLAAITAHMAALEGAPASTWLAVGGASPSP